MSAAIIMGNDNDNGRLMLLSSYLLCIWFTIRFDKIQCFTCRRDESKGFTRCMYEGLDYNTDNSNLSGELQRRETPIICYMPWHQIQIHETYMNSKLCATWQLAVVEWSIYISKTLIWYWTSEWTKSQTNTKTVKADGEEIT